MNATVLRQTLFSQGIFNGLGITNFNLLGINIIVQDPSIVGNVIQEWLMNFMNQNSIAYRLKPNTQEFPDFLMHTSRNDVDLMEVKCFTKSPNFDVANYEAYVRSLTVNAYRLDADYLIFEYSTSSNGIQIKNIWLKKVWEICGPSARSPVKIQWKQSSPVNIRPATWYSSKAKFKPFNTRLDFVKALEQVVNTSGISSTIQKNWYKNVSSLYTQQTGNML
jgi:type II restriction enzyme